MDVVSALLEPVQTFLDPTQRLYWLNAASAVAIAFVLYLIRRDRRQTGLRQFLAFCFPKQIWLHPSTRTDAIYFVVNKIVLFVLIAPFLAVIFPHINHWTLQLLAYLDTPVSRQAPVLILVLFSIAAILIFDLSIYLAHLAFHKVEFLWQFHKVHHSAEVLNPLTAYRMHPVDDLITMTLGAIFAAIVHGIFSFYWSYGFASLQLSVIAVALMLFYFFGYNLRHSHIWLSYGTLWNRILISPCQHQIHHSRAIEHKDKNLGFIFALWDGIFGTLYVPQKREALEFGLMGESEIAYRRALACYLKPFQDNFLSRPYRVLAVIAVVGFVSSTSIKTSFAIVDADSIFIEELTTSELATLMERGYQNVIIPTGGVEQNGKHLVLGKHNYVVKFAAESIATSLGRTLVAPVVRYVPQGSINPPDGHMRFAGTLSIRESTYQALLEDTARSLIQHGFKRLIFIGDSIGNQPSQRDIATRLSTEFSGQGVKVIHVARYYENNGQRQWLEAQGYSSEEIGMHAGLRDTSEMLYVAPQGVRRYDQQLSSRYDGVSGAYWKSGTQIGKAMLQLKIDAAIGEIREHFD